MKQEFKSIATVLIMFIFTTYGCNNKTKDNTEAQLINMHFDENKFENKIFYKKNTDLQMIFFNEDENIIGEITSIRVLDNYLLLYERKRDLLFLYSINGKYLSTIGKKGRGPEEYARITYYDFYKDDGISVIEILDANRYRIQVYDLTGKLIETKKMKKNVLGVSFIHTDYGYFFYTPDNNYFSNDKYMLILCSNDLKKIKNKFIIDNSDLVPTTGNNFVKNTNDILFHYGYNDTIYKLNEKHVVPYINVDFGSRKVANSNLSTKKTIKEFQEVLYFSDKCYLGSINKMLLNDFKLSFQFKNIKINTPVPDFYGEFNFEDGKSRFFKFIASDFPFGFRIIGLENEFAIGIIYPDHLSEKGINYFKEMYNREIKIESNPILVKIYEKH